MPFMKDLFDFTPVSSWVENFNESTHDSASRTRIFESFVMLPEVEESARVLLDRIHRQQSRVFVISRLYCYDKVIFLTLLSALRNEPTLRTQLLDTKPAWGMDALAPRKFLTINFTAIEVPDETLEQAFWNSVSDHLRHLSPPVTATLSNTDAYLNTFFNHTASGTRTDVENWICDNRDLSVDLSRSDRFSFWVYLDEPAKGSPTCNLYFRSGNGWYGSSFAVEKGWNRVSLTKAQFKVADQPAGWKQINGVRVGV